VTTANVGGNSSRPDRCVQQHNPAGGQPSLQRTFAAIAALACPHQYRHHPSRPSERYLNRRDTKNSSLAPLSSNSLSALSGLAIAVAAMQGLAPAGVQAATGLGFTTMLLIAVFGRL